MSFAARIKLNFPINLGVTDSVEFKEKFEVKFVTLNGGLIVTSNYSQMVSKLLETYEKRLHAVNKKY